VIASTAYGNRFLFTGREYATTFGIYEYRARAYHPGLGRFTSEDPMGFAAGDYNLFRYCGDDPEDRTDPMGTDSPPPVGAANLGLIGRWDPNQTVTAWAQWRATANGGGAITVAQVIKNTQQAIHAAAQRPDASRYAAGEPYKASREAVSDPTFTRENDQTTVSRLVRIIAFDKEGNPVPAGTLLTEKMSFSKDQKCLTDTREVHQGDRTEGSTGALPPDLWVRRFNCQDGYSKFTQKFSSTYGKTVTFPEAKLQATGELNFYSVQHAFFVPPGD
jgi:RHS repeat-associated protein